MRRWRCAASLDPREQWQWCSPLLAARQAIAIDDVGDPLPTYWERRRGKRARRYVINPATMQRVYDLPEVSPRGQHIRAILTGIASAIGGDHVIDLARILRLPGTMNRKDERNGKKPVPCELVECDPTRRYSLSAFDRFAQAGAEKLRTEVKPAHRTRTTTLVESGTAAAACTVDKTATPASFSLTDDDKALLDRAMSAKFGEEFTRLWTGDMSGHLGKDGKPDHSKADAALCRHLTFWTRCVAERIDKFFRNSKLIRPKWDETRHGDGRTYGEGTIGYAIRVMKDRDDDANAGTDGASAVSPELFKASIREVIRAMEKGGAARVAEEEARRSCR